MCVRCEHGFESCSEFGGDVSINGRGLDVAEMIFFCLMSQIVTLDILTLSLGLKTLSGSLFFDYIVF